MTVMVFEYILSIYIRHCVQNDSLFKMKYISPSQDNQRIVREDDGYLFGADTFLFIKSKK